MDAKVRDKARKAAAKAHAAQMGVLGGRPVEAAIDAYEAAIKAAGYVMVPREITDEMWDAAVELFPSLEEVEQGIDEHGQDIFYEVIPGPIEIYRAMIKAATNPVPEREF